MNIQMLVERYQQVFDPKDITIVDYDGVNAFRKDIAYVFVCEILKTLCSHSESLNVNAIRENHKPNTTHLHLVFLLRNYVHMRGHKICKFDVKFISDSVNYYRLKKIDLPTIRSNLKILHPLSLSLDEKFRASFGSKIMYNNQSAARQIIQNFIAEEIDEHLFFHKHRWMKFLNAQYERLRKSGQLCAFNGKPFKGKG